MNKPSYCFYLTFAICNLGGWVNFLLMFWAIETHWASFRPKFCKIKVVWRFFHIILAKISSMTFFVNIGPKLASNNHSNSENYFDSLKDPINASMFMKLIVEMDVIRVIEKSN